MKELVITLMVLAVLGIAIKFIFFKKKTTVVEETKQGGGSVDVPKETKDHQTT